MSVIDMLIAAAATGGLFVLFVVLRPTRDCSGDCGACNGICPTERERS